MKDGIQRTMSGIGVIWEEENSMTNDPSRSFFQWHLSHLGYQIEIDNPVFEEVHQSYLHSTLYEVVQTDWLPVLEWKNMQMKAILEPYKTIHN